jgi:TetR/AcrR family transcriptional regulator, transcriptional repressor of bet genes
MTFTRIRDIRRQELLQAAYEVLKREGLQATTTDKIAVEAGAAKGIVHHYFPNKRDLILTTLRYAHALRRNEIVRRLRLATSPHARLAAIIDVNLGETYLTHQYCRLWIATAVEALNDPEFARLQKIIRKRERSTLLHALRQSVPKREIDEVLLAIRALMEACRLWVGYIDWYDSAHAIALAYTLLKARIPGFPEQGSNR